MLKSRSIAINPIIVKELRSRMRGSRPFITLTVMLLVFAGITYGVYRIALTVMGTYTGTPISPQIGQALFTMLAFLLLIFICIITPAVTAGAISSEKEQLTYEMLLSTPLHPARILWGKLFSALSYVFLLIFSAIPIASLIYVFGGVSLREMLKALVVLIVVAITLGVFGIFMSSLLQRSLRATVISYIIIFVLLFGSVVIYAVVGIFQNNIPPRWILVLNPISILASALSNVTNTYNSVLSFIPILGADLSILRGDTFGIDHIPRPLYHYSLPLYGLFSIIVYSLSTRLVMPTKKWKISRKEILIFLGVIFSLMAVTIGAFYFTADRYENAPFLQQTDQFFMGPIREPAVPQAVVVEPAQPVVIESKELNTSGLSIEDQAAIYSSAINSAVVEFSSSRNTEPENLYLVSTILDTQEDQSFTFILPEPIQLAIQDQLTQSGFNVIWVDNVEQIFDNEEVEVDKFDYVLNMGNTEFVEEDTFSIYINISLVGVSEFQTIFTLRQNEEGKWEISSQENVFDAEKTN